MANEINNYIYGNQRSEYKEQILYAVRRELSWEKLHQAIQIARKKLENNKLED